MNECVSESTNVDYIRAFNVSLFIFDLIITYDQCGTDVFI